MPSTHLGRNVILIPGTPSAPADIVITVVDAVAVSRSPFTGQSQVYNWGILPRQAKVALPPLPNAIALQWVAFLKQLQGQANCFQFSSAFCAAYPDSLCEDDNTTPRYWGLSNNARSWSINRTRFYGIDFEVTEIK